MIESIKKDKQKFVSDKLSNAYNFFKHGSKDPEQLIKFNPEASTFVIWESISLYFKLTGELNGLMRAFNGWFVLKNKSMFITEETKNIIEQVEHISTEDRELFLSAAQHTDSKMAT